MKTVFLLLLVIISAPLVAGDIKLTLSVYEMDPVIAAALEDRLIAGGETAVATAAKLPDFEKQNRLTKVDSIAIEAEEAGRLKKSSSDKIIRMPWGDNKEGLDVEVDLFENHGVLQANMNALFTESDGDEPIERTLTTQASFRSGIPVLLCRWQLDDNLLILLGEAEFDGEFKESPGQGQVVYVESAFFPSGPDAGAGRNRLASVRFAGTSGQRSKAGITKWIDHEQVPEDEQPGVRAVIDPLLNEDGTLKLSAKSTYSVKAGGRTRGDDGERVPRLEIRDADGSYILEPQKPVAVPVVTAMTGDSESTPDRSVASLRFSVPGEE